MVAGRSSAASLLRDARKRAGLTQAELARRAGVTQSVVSAYESGSRQPSLQTLDRLMSATGYELSVRLRRSPSRLRRLKGPLGSRVRQRRSKLLRSAAHHGVSNIRVFGSVARGEDSADSDVDLLVDVPPGMGLLGLARLQRELEDILEAPVDLVPAEDLKPAVRADANPDLIPL